MPNFTSQYSKKCMNKLGPYRTRAFGYVLNRKLQSEINS